MDSTEELMEFLNRNPNANKIIEQTLRQRRSIKTPFGTITTTSHSLFDVESLPDDFRLLEPGSNVWRRFWMAHPEKQERMLEWKEMLEAIKMEDKCDHTYAIELIPGHDIEYIHDPERVSSPSKFQTVFDFCPWCGLNFLGDDKGGKEDEKNNDS